MWSRIIVMLLNNLINKIFKTNCLLFKQTKYQKTPCFNIAFKQLIKTTNETFILIINQILRKLKRSHMFNKRD